MENVQLNFARCVTGAKRGTSHKLIYDEISWQTLSERRKTNKLKFMQKIVHKQAPPYLVDLLPTVVGHDTPYNLRNRQNHRQYDFHTSKFQHSLLPDCVNMWNELGENVRTIENKELFKETIALKNNHNPLFNGINRKLGLIHAQFRMECSNLNSHLFDLHVVDNSYCSCMNGREDCFHFFFSCPLYNVERLKLFNDVQKLCVVSLECLLYGDKKLNLNQNLEIFGYVERFILETGRF